MRVLIVEDDSTLGEAISRHLQKQGQAVDWVTDGALADRVLAQQSFDLIILDLNLPGLGGERVLEKLRRRDDPAPVLILTARGQVEDRIALLNLGADDYLTKPFDFGELDARCRALLRRSQGQAQDLLKLGNTELDRRACEVRIDGRLIELAPRELRLLEVFMSHTGRVLSKAELIDHLYGFDETPGANAIELYVGRLRKKMEQSSVQICTLRGLGYVVKTPSS
jgi:two-component system response regulator TctD